MQLLGVCTLLLLISTSYGADNSTVATGLAANPLSTSVVIAIPTSCQYSQKAAILYINDTKNTNIKTASFTIPQCRLKRDLIVANDTQSGNVQNTNVGYQVEGLSPNTSYIAYYNIGGEDLNSVNFNTANVQNYLPEIFARSGGMIVITVILSVAMFLLVVGLIVVLVLGGKAKK
ncbi:uroplakin-2 [Mixophyes fleayi]|uniref:uroplakin-2 n=1 Tax=Mixophyes fleayi TaxID=3061075 RepID=UPI003F4D86AB